MRGLEHTPSSPYELARSSQKFLLIMRRMRGADKMHRRCISAHGATASTTLPSTRGSPQKTYVCLCSLLFLCIIAQLLSWLVYVLYAELFVWLLTSAYFDAC